MTDPAEARFIEFNRQQMLKGGPVMSRRKFESARVNAGQPRVPAGSSDGGQFAPAEATSSTGRAAERQDPERLYRRDARRGIKEVEDVFAVTRDSPFIRAEDHETIDDINATIQDIDPDDDASIRAGLKRVHRLAGDIQATGHGDNIRKGVRDVYRKLGLGQLPG